MKITKKGLDVIKKYEGCKLYAYKCPAAVWTIGVGHTLGVKKGDVITQIEADNFLRKDVNFAERVVDRLNIKFKQGQYNALVSFIFNVGIGAFDVSTLRKKILINQNDKTIPKEFQRWIFAGGQPLNGLIRRRKEESELYA